MGKIKKHVRRQQGKLQYYVETNPGFVVVFLRFCIFLDSFCWDFWRIFWIIFGGLLESFQMDFATVLEVSGKFFFSYFLDSIF